MANELETKFAGSAVAEPETEPDGSSRREPAEEPDESISAEGDSGEAGCPIDMRIFGSPRCGRKLHIAPDGVDEKPVCLMHSKDPNKQSGSLFDTFWLEFERILENAGEDLAHFERFVFPQLDLSGRKFQAACRFNKATFAEGANLSQATFTQNANFGEATFTQDANFSAAIFTQNANFFSTTFMQNVVFSYATFAQEANFLHATFTQKAGFEGATFTQNAIFSSATFTNNASFSGATFTQVAYFPKATFKQCAYLESATFTRTANFGEATFMQNAEFRSATFIQATRFVETKFHGTANWCECRFLDQAEFRRTKFEPLVEGEPSAIFAQAKFSKPGEVVFDDVDLSRVLFHNCDVSQVWFTSSVRWGTRRNNRGLTVFDEKHHSIEWSDDLEIMVDLQRDYQSVAQVYRQLKRNYDTRLDYWTGNEFHFGEMEMKRLAGPSSGPLLRLRQWLHSRLSLVALYRYASDYGNSYRKPLLWLFGVLLLSTALLPLPFHGFGLKRQGARQAETYASVWRVGDGWTPNLWAEARLAGKGAITSVDAATFQRSAEYAPAYPWGRVLAIFETLLTSTLFALFLLAIRRQFRR